MYHVHECHNWYAAVYRNNPPLIIGNVLRVVFVVVDPRASCHRFDILDRRRLGLNVDDGSRRRRWGRHGTGVEWGGAKKTVFALLYTRNVWKV